MKNRQKLLSIVMIGVLLFTLAGCNSGGGKKELSPTETVMAGIDALKEQDAEKINQYFDGYDVSGMEYENEEDKEFVKLLLSKLEVEPEEETISEDGETATVKANITGIDLVKVYTQMISDLMGKIWEKMANGEELTDEESQELVMGYIKDLVGGDEVPVTSTDLMISLKKVGDAWKMEQNETFFNALISGLDLFEDGVEEAD